MKDFDIKKFLTENQITAASQDINEEEKEQFMDPDGNKTAPGYVDKSGKGYIPDPYYIFAVRFKDGTFFFDYYDKGMGGITKAEWWEKIANAAINGKGRASLVKKIQDMGLIKGTKNLPVSRIDFVDRAKTQEEAIRKTKDIINQVRKSHEGKVINTQTDEDFDEKIEQAKEKRADKRTFKNAKDFGDGNAFSDETNDSVSTTKSDDGGIEVTKATKTPEEIEAAAKKAAKIGKKTDPEDAKKKLDAMYDDLQDKIISKKKEIAAQIKDAPRDSKSGKLTNPSPELKKAAKDLKKLQGEFKKIEDYFKIQSNKSEPKEPMNEGKRRWDKLKEFFNIK